MMMIIIIIIIIIITIIIITTTIIIIITIITTTTITNNLSARPRIVTQNLIRDRGTIAGALLNFGFVFVLDCGMTD